MNYLWLILSGVGMGLVAAVPIGPVNLICVRRTFARGPLNGFMSGLGAATGDALFAVVIGFGFTWVAQMIQGYAPLIELVGGIVLVLFGIQGLRHAVPRLDQNSTPDRGSSSLVGAMLSTFALTVTNPATLFAFASMFAGLGSLAGGPGDFGDAALVVAGVFLGSAGWWLVLTTVVGLFHARVDARIMTRINRISALLVLLFGLVVLGNLAWKTL